MRNDRGSMKKKTLQLSKIWQTKDFTEYEPAGFYQKDSSRAGLTKKKVMRALLVYATTASYPCIKTAYNIHPCHHHLQKKIHLQGGGEGGGKGSDQINDTACLCHYPEPELIKDELGRHQATIEIGYHS